MSDIEVVGDKRRLTKGPDIVERFASEVKRTELVVPPVVTGDPLSLSAQDIAAWCAYLVRVDLLNCDTRAEDVCLCEGVACAPCDTPKTGRCITLIGMPGSGKSSIGKALASELGYAYLDCDVLIESCTGRRLHELISQYGSEGFLDIEAHICSLVQLGNTVIAPGGSVVYRERAMKQFSQLGTVLYLDVSYEALVERLGDLRARGVVLPSSYTLKDLYDERRSLYEHYADVSVPIGFELFEDTLTRCFEYYTMHNNSA